MSTFKKTKVVMLSTNEKAAMFISKKTPAIMQIGDNKVENEFWAGQHLYFLSDEEIKEGDWLLSKEGTIHNNFGWNFGDTKIIATTDKSLTINSIYGVDSFDTSIFSGSGKSEIVKLPQMFNLPQPSQSFIEKFVEEYNKGNQITEVLVEYHEDIYFQDELQARGKLKINPKDNTITIRKKKDSLNRAELDPILELIREIATDNLDRVSGGIKNKAIERLKWIEENL